MQSEDSKYLDIATLLKNHNIRVFHHEFHQSDLDRHLHNHPWPFVSIILEGEYKEFTPKPATEGTSKADWLSKRFKKGDINSKLNPYEYHRLELITPTVKTLVIAGKAILNWGFLTESGHVNYQDYLELKYADYETDGHPADLIDIKGQKLNQ